MDNTDSVTTPLMPLQDVYDGKNHYVPSFFRIKLGVFADFMDTANIPFGSFAAFFHEYIHFLQDVTTLYGLMNLGNITYYVRDAASRVNKLPLGSFCTPIELQPRKGDCGYDNYLARRIYNGSQINPKIKDVTFVNYKINKTIVADQEIEYVDITFRDKSTQIEYLKQFGGHILTEGMAYICERVCNESIFEKNGFKYPVPSDYPYSINTLLAKSIYPKIADEYIFLVAIADISLLTYNCGLTYVRLLEYLKSINFMDTVGSDNYLESIDNLYSLCHKYINWSLERFQSVQNIVLDSLKEYIKIPELCEINQWISILWDKALSLRTKCPHFITDILMSSLSIDDVRSNHIFSAIYLTLGTPLIINADDEGAIVPPHDFHPTNQFMPGLFWAIDEVARTLSCCKEHKQCALLEFCQRSTLLCPNLVVNEDCKSQNWKRAEDTNGLCPVGLIWKHWGLAGHEPLSSNE